MSEANKQEYDLKMKFPASDKEITVEAGANELLVEDDAIQIILKIRFTVGDDSQEFSTHVPTSRRQLETLLTQLPVASE